MYLMFLMDCYLIEGEIKKSYKTAKQNKTHWNSGTRAPKGPMK